MQMNSSPNFNSHYSLLWFLVVIASMLAACGQSYAMSGGHPAALAAARFVAPPCEENGEVSVLERMFPLGGRA